MLILAISLPSRALDPGYEISGDPLEQGPGGPWDLVITINIMAVIFMFLHYESNGKQVWRKNIKGYAKIAFIALVLSSLLYVLEKLD